MLSSLRTFLRYYLPTVMKLLAARAKVEREVNSGAGEAFAQRVRDAMAQVQTAFHKQLDALQEFRFINLESEMDVLADMLRADGLTGEAESGAPQAEEAAQDDPFAGLFSRGGK